MKQLQLEFVSPEQGVEEEAPRASAQVHELAHHRAAKNARVMSSVYSAIYESIKHIDVRRRERNADLDSRFG